MVSNTHLDHSQKLEQTQHTNDSENLHEGSSLEVGEHVQHVEWND